EHRAEAAGGGGGAGGGGASRRWGEPRRQRAPARRVRGPEDPPPARADRAREMAHAAVVADVGVAQGEQRRHVGEAPSTGDGGPAERRLAGLCGTEELDDVSTPPPPPPGHGGEAVGGPTLALRARSTV